MKQPDFLLRIPTTKRGKVFIEDLKQYLNKDTYKFGKPRYSGKRVTSFRGHTRKEDADTVKIYVKDKRQVLPSSNLQELIHEVEHFRRKAEAAEHQLRIIKDALTELRRRI